MFAGIISSGTMILTVVEANAKCRSPENYFKDLLIKLVIMRKTPNIHGNLNIIVLEKLEFFRGACYVSPDKIRVCRPSSCAFSVVETNCSD